MAVSTPLVSVVMTTYNHEKYIAEAIKSVLEQTFTDFELIIINDGSSDNTDKIIKLFLSDKRIVYIHQDNQGPSVAVNNGILTAKGKYIALMSGDDICYPERLEKQYQYLETSGQKIAFSWVDFIDDNSHLILGNHFAKNFFNYQNKTRAEMLNTLFFKGNYLCSVTAFIEKDVLLKAGLFHLSSIQLQDFDMWIKLVKHYEIFILTEKLIKYRVRSDGQNLSHPDSNSIRTYFEKYQIYKNVFDKVPIDLFKEAFAQNLQRDDFQDGIEYELEKAFLYLNTDLTFFRSIGVEKLFHLLQDNNILSVAKEKYAFGLPQLYEITKNIDLTNSLAITSIESSKFWKFYRLLVKLKLKLGWQ
ncbi:glycosyltransferase family 2 protein [Tolypothrix sp. FACHB-123]|uniref:glycosyltransferase family 2 protein n=1 Tax=Tolypothrix sp. FACHB-123 TaxID=2692868 RepID=UPI001688BA37|nr:glycosyltransferase family 2 protein [Tolypothrix sp. FACHB-123]MBD2355696.1 glycosyltransferase family 2 protein [Tolypothrix sp. FACHB-123]